MWPLIAAAGWCAAAAAGALAYGRAVRIAEQRRPRPRPVPAPEPPQRPGAAGLGGAVLALSYAVDEDDARKWLHICAERGADWAMQRELWAAWEADRARNVHHLHDHRPEQS